MNLWSITDDGVEDHGIEETDINAMSYPDLLRATAALLDSGFHDRGAIEAAQKRLFSLARTLEVPGETQRLLSEIDRSLAALADARTALEVV